jgi:hypothetical protein
MLASEAVLASDEMLSSEDGVVMMDFHVDNYNNLSRRIIAFLCIDSTNLILPLDTIQLEVLALFIDSTRHTCSYSAESLGRIHNMHNRSSFVTLSSSSSSHQRIVKTVVYIQIVPLSNPPSTSQSRPDF